MRKTLFMFILSTTLVAATGCSKLSRDIPAGAAVGDNQYTDMRGSGDYYDDVIKETDENGNPIKKKDIKLGDNEKFSEQKYTDESIAESISESEAESIAESKAAEEKEKLAQKVAEGGGSSSSSDGSSSSSTGETNPDGTPKSKGDNVHSILVDTTGKGDNKSGIPSSTHDQDYPKIRENPATIIINGTKYNTYITVKGYYMGATALRKLNGYNGSHAVEYNTDIPDGYQPVIVNYTVTASEGMPNESDTLVPETRVRDSKGAEFDDIPTHVSFLRMGNYNDDSSTTKTWDAVFEIPEDEDEFQVIFGAKSGNTYKFRSSEFEASDTEDEDDED